MSLPQKVKSTLWAIVDYMAGNTARFVKNPGKDFTRMGKYSLIAADGCAFNIARSPKDPPTFHPANGRSGRGFNSLHTISLYGLLSKRYLDAVFQLGRFSLQTI